jgi:hypothetical protein
LFMYSLSLIVHMKKSVSDLKIIVTTCWNSSWSLCLEWSHSKTNIINKMCRCSILHEVQVF